MEEETWEKLPSSEQDVFMEKAKYLIDRKYFLIHKDVEMLAKHIWKKQNANTCNHKV